MPQTSFIICLCSRPVTLSWWCRSKSFQKSRRRRKSEGWISCAVISRASQAVWLAGGLEGHLASLAGKWLKQFGWGGVCVWERETRGGVRIWKSRGWKCVAVGVLWQRTAKIRDGWLLHMCVCIVAYVSLYCMSLYGQEKSWRSLKMSKFLKQGQNKA